MIYGSMISLQYESLKHVVFALLASFVITAIAQDQTRFISIDCGLQSNIRSYNEKTTGIKYVSDETFIDTDTGEIQSVLQKYREIQEQYWSLRSFPKGDRNCYNIPVSEGTKYLIRASFLYGNYDGKGEPPVFDLHLGPSLWDTVNITDSSNSVDKEIIHVAQRSYVHVCLVNTRNGVPFISAIELRPLDNSTYSTQMGSLEMFVRRDAGSIAGYRYGIRKGHDRHDRFWYSMQYVDWKNLSTSQTISSQDPNDGYDIPSIVMSTAATHKNPNASLNIWWPDNGATISRYYFYMHFAEIEQLGANESREFNILYNGDFFHGPVSPSYLRRTTVSTPTPFSGSLHNFSLSKTQSSTHPPIINAFETYTVNELPQSESDQQDVDAITKIKSTYGLRRNWQGDPCAPKDYSWEGLTCSFEGYMPPRIISLKLSSSELTGEIAPSIANLTMIEELDLSNNNLTGSVPDFLAQLPKLRVLNLENNELTGSLPSELLDKWKKNVISLSVNGNINILCAKVSCKKKKSRVSVVAISIAGSIVLLLVVTAAWWGLIKRKKQRRGVEKAKSRPTTGQHYSMESRKRQFTYSDIKSITNNFERIIGKGGFGTVYYGQLDDSDNTQVAVKVLSSPSVEKYQQFQAEVDILLRVYHRNLTTLIGYFVDGNDIGLVYEYMANGDLKSHLSDNSSISILKWEERLRIAVDSAQGLEYLHHGCKPPIIHRDVKPANILLNENFQAKLSDFGISKTFPSDHSGTAYVSTVVAGTPGYLDPEYFKSNRLNEKSDVYSFGVLLMEIITGRPALLKGRTGNIFLSDWVISTLEKGLISHIVDERLLGNFNLNAAWKVAEIAMNCVSPSSVQRPTMSQVVGELKTCLEMAKVGEPKEGELRDSVGISIPSSFIAEDMSQPLAR